MSKIRKRTITFLLFALCFMISSNISQFYFGNYNDISIREQNRDQISDINVINDPKAAANEPNGKPLLVNQFANTSKSYVNSNLPINVSFTLAQDWISKDVTISYEGVSQKKNRVINGTFILLLFFLTKQAIECFKDDYPKEDSLKELKFKEEMLEFYPDDWYRCEQCGEIYQKEEKVK